MGVDVDTRRERVRVSASHAPPPPLAPRVATALLSADRPQRGQGGHQSAHGQLPQGVHGDLLRDHVLRGRPLQWGRVAGMRRETVGRGRGAEGPAAPDGPCLSRTEG